MAALTWREVAAPDFSTSLQGINQFSRLLGDSLSGAERAIGKFDSAQDEMANRAILERSLAIRDPAAYEAALSDGSLLGSDARRASGQTLQGLDARVGTLLNQAQGRVALESSTRENDQAKAFDALSSDAVRAEQARFAGKPDLALEASINERMGTIGARNALGLQRGFQDSETAGLGNDNTRVNIAQTKQNMAQSATRFDWDKLDRTEQRQTLDDVTNAAAAGYDASTIDGFIAENNITGHRAALLRAGMGGGGAGGDGSGTGGAGGIGPAGGQRVMGWTPVGGENSRASVDNKMGLISKGLGGVGVDAQLSKEQFLNQDMTALEGKPAGRNNFGNMRNLDGSWKQFNSRQEYNQAQRAWLERRWNEGARTIRDAVEGRVTRTPAQIAAAGNISTNTGQRRILAEDPTGFAGRIAKAQQNPDASIDSVAAGIAKETGASVSDVKAQMRMISTRMGNQRVPAGWSVIGEIYKEGRVSTNPVNSWLSYMTGTTSAGGRDIIDENAVQGAIDNYGKVTSGTTATRGGIEAREQTKAALVQDYTQKYSRLQGLRQRQANGSPISRAVLNKAEQDAETARLRAEDAVGGSITEDEAASAKSGLNFTGKAPQGAATTPTRAPIMTGSTARTLMGMGVPGLGLMGAGYLYDTLRR